MLPSLFALIILGVFLLLVAWLFWSIAVEIIVNLTLLYLIGLRVYAEVRKQRRKLNAYVFAAVVGLAVVLFGIKAWPLWSVTLGALVAFICAQAWFVAKH